MPSVIKTITDAANTFRNRIAMLHYMDFSSVVAGLAESTKQMVQNVTDLRQIGTRVYKATGMFVELPAVVVKVKNLVTKVVSLFGDIKSVVMNLYNVRVTCHSGSCVSLVQYDSCDM